MQRSPYWVALGCVALTACGKGGSTSGPARDDDPPPRVDMPASTDTAALTEANNTLAFDLYGRARSAPGNLALSPVSVSIALSMTWGGARTETAAEMQRVLHFEGDPDRAMTLWGAVAGALQSPDRKLTLRIANRLFGERSFQFERPFLDKTEAAYGAPLEPVDFKTAPDKARAHINDWVSDRTNDRIKNLLPSGALTSDTRMVLVNAIYFLANWAQPFTKEATFDQPFTIAPGKQKQAATMHLQGHFRLAKLDGVAMLEMPYEGNDAVMWIVLPDKVDGLAEVEGKLDRSRLDTWRKSLAAQQVNVSLPRFTIDPPEPLDLAAHLTALGMQRAFDAAQADFTGIGVPADPQKRLYVSAVFHKAFVKVDEKGTEAAAATAVVMAEGTGMPAKAEAFNADHPFLFLIVDQSTGLILFMGRVVDPA